MKGKHNANAPEGMSFSAGMMHMGCCKNWRKQINFPEDWDYNYDLAKYTAKKGTKHVFKVSSLSDKNKPYIEMPMVIMQSDLLYAK